MWRCVLSRCRTVTLTASRIPHPARGPRRVAVSAPACRHPSCQRRRAASFFELGRVCLPQNPRPFPMLDPFHPQEVFAPNWLVVFKPLATLRGQSFFGWCFLHGAFCFKPVPSRSHRSPLAATPFFLNFLFPLARGVFFPATKRRGHASDPAIR